MQTNNELKRLCEIMAKLRSPEGCPWDQQQTLASLKPFLLEEAYETWDAIDDAVADPSPTHQLQHLEELGDLLMQIVFQAQIQSEAGAFDMADVCRTLSEKLIRRHPHVFGDADKNLEAINARWEQIKEEERRQKGVQRTSIFDGIPKAMPAFSRSVANSKVTADVGFVWPNAQGAFLQLQSEVEELKEAMQLGATRDIEHELGDVMLASIELSRYLNLDAEQTLAEANKRFETRFRHVESAVAEDGSTLKSTSLEAYAYYWKKAKAATKQGY